MSSIMNKKNATCWLFVPVMSFCGCFTDFQRDECISANSNGYRCENETRTPISTNGPFATAYIIEHHISNSAIKSSDDNLFFGLAQTSSKYFITLKLKYVDEGMEKTIQQDIDFPMAGKHSEKQVAISLNADFDALLRENGRAKKVDPVEVVIHAICKDTCEITATPPILAPSGMLAVKVMWVEDRARLDEIAAQKAREAARIAQAEREEAAKKAAAEQQLKDEQRERARLLNNIESLQAKGWDGWIETLKASGVDRDSSAILNSYILNQIVTGQGEHKVGRYYYSTVPQNFLGPNLNHMANLSDWSPSEDGFKATLTFPGDEMVSGGASPVYSEVLSPPRRYNDVLLRYKGVAKFENKFGEQMKLPTFAVVGVCGWNGIDTGSRDNPVFTYSLRELRGLANLIDSIPTGNTDIEWVQIPGGSFMMGSVDRTAAQPVHRVTVASFQMAKTLVTNKQYQACVATGACKAPHFSDGTCDVFNHNSDDPNWNKGDVPESFKGDDQPVVCVDWNEAQAFAKWAGGRLPTAVEWEYAARSGGKGQEYPWGDENANCQLAVFCSARACSPTRQMINKLIPAGTTIDLGVVDYGCGRNSTWAVCSKPEGNTAQGLCDMAGNAWEWTQDWYHDSYNGAPDDGSARASAGPRVVRGGSWITYDRFLRAASSFGRRKPSLRANDLGIRLAR